MADIGESRAVEFLKPGHAFTLPDVLFRKIEDEQIAEWRAKFGAE